MNILEPEKLEAGEPFKIDLTDEETDALALAGLQKIIRDSNIPVIAKKASKKLTGLNTAITGKTCDLYYDELSELVLGSLDDGRRFPLFREFNRDSKNEARLSWSTFPAAEMIILSGV